MVLRVFSLAPGIAIMAKWRTNRGVTGFLPPPGGAQAEHNVISYFDKRPSPQLQFVKQLRFEKTHQVVFPEQLISVIETSKVKKLSQQLDWRLRPISVQLRHVKIVDKENQSFASRSS